MIKLSEAKDAFYDASGTLSENTRKLCFAGIAIIWIFKVGDKNAGGITFSAELLFPLAAFVCSLIVDVLQYFYKSTIWWAYYAINHARGKKDEDDVNPSGLINFFTGVFFYAKVACCGCGYYLLIVHIISALNHSTPASPP